MIRQVDIISYVAGIDSWPASMMLSTPPQTKTSSNCCQNIILYDFIYLSQQGFKKKKIAESTKKMVD